VRCQVPEEFDSLTELTEMGVGGDDQNPKSLPHRSNQIAKELFRPSDRKERENKHHGWRAVDRMHGGQHLIDFVNGVFDDRPGGGAGKEPVGSGLNRQRLFQGNAGIQVFLIANMGDCPTENLR
jgi:hypothetical protein